MYAYSIFLNMCYLYIYITYTNEFDRGGYSQHMHKYKIILMLTQIGTNYYKRFNF